RTFPTRRSSDLNRTCLIGLTVACFSSAAETRFRNLLFTCNPINRFRPQRGTLHEWVFMTLTDHQTITFDVFMQDKPRTLSDAFHAANTNAATLTERIVH